MPTQADFQRVTECIINPIKRHWNGEFEADTIDDFVSDLYKFSEHTLSDAMHELRRDSKQRPRLAHVIEVCRKHIPKTAYVPKEGKATFHCLGHAEIAHPIQARQIMESPSGQKALELGIARDLLNEYEVNGRMDFDMNFVDKCRHGLTNAIEALGECREKDIKNYTAYLEIFNAMQEREKRLYAKYYKPEKIMM